MFSAAQPHSCRVFRANLAFKFQSIPRHHIRNAFQCTDMINNCKPTPYIYFLFFVENSLYETHFAKVKDYL